MIFRILPFLIIILFVTISFRMADFFYDMPSIIHDLKASDKKEDSGHGKSEKDGEKKDPPPEKPKFDEDFDPIHETKENLPQENIFTDIETQVLQSLVARRGELEQRENDISLKEASLLVIEKNIDKKVTELKSLQKELGKIMEQYQVKENEKITSLVKVYESMKPAEAAKIFEQLQMSILVEVADNMKEAKLGQILAKMDAYKAKEITVELAGRRRIER